MKQSQVKQVAAVKKFNTMQGAIVAFNMIATSKNYLSGEMDYGTIVMTSGDKIVRIHDYAAQVNQTVFVREKFNKEVSTYLEWYDQFKEAAEDKGYQYADRHEHVDYLADFHPQMKDNRSYAVVNGKRVDVSTDICNLCSKWSRCSFNDNRCDILS